MYWGGQRFLWERNQVPKLRGNRNSCDLKCSTPHEEGSSMRKTLTALAFVLATGSASRAQYTGNSLLSDCQSDSVYRQGMCDGYISSIADMSTIGTNQSWLSFPKGTTLGQVRDVVVKSLKDHPKDRNGSAFVLVFGALQEAFPGPAKINYTLMKDKDGNVSVVLLIPEPCEPKKSDTN